MGDNKTAPEHLYTHKLNHTLELVNQTCISFAQEASNREVCASTMHQTHKYSNSTVPHIKDGNQKK